MIETDRTDNPGLDARRNVPVVEVLPELADNIISTGQQPQPTTTGANTYRQLVEQQVINEMTLTEVPGFEGLSRLEGSTNVYVLETGEDPVRFVVINAGESAIFVAVASDLFLGGNRFVSR